jgi:hypothetical protein
VICEASTEDRKEALSIHRSYVEGQLNRSSDDSMLNAELKRVKELQEEMVRISNNPRDRLVVVLKSRVVRTGAVGRVIYADHNRNHCRIEFGDGEKVEKVSCALSSVDVIDWTPLPPMIPMAGERVMNRQNGEEVVVVEWRVNEVRVQPVGLSEDTYTLDRTYVVRKDSVIHM